MSNQTNNNYEINMKKVTFGIVNCNRLYYLKSCLESLLKCTEDYTNKEIIIVDNASVESGTEEYLKEKELQGIRVFRQKERDPSNEFAKALNIICLNSTGEYVCPLQGDSQFTLRNGWLKKYIEYAEKYKNFIGSMALDAQRKVTIDNNSPYGLFDESDLESDFPFFIDVRRPPVQGAADCIYTREIIEKIFPWNVNNKNHEGGLDSETHMLRKVESMIKSGELKNVFTVVPKFPVSVAIYTDKRGTMGRIRGNKRYGDYWEAKKDNLYYEVIDYEDIIKLKDENEGKPLPIEKIAKGIEWDVPIDENGSWKKNPIRPEDCEESDWQEII